MLTNIRDYNIILIAGKQKLCKFCETCYKNGVRIKVMKMKFAQRLGNLFAL